VTTEFFPAVVLLLLVADPFGNIPIFIAALRDVPGERRLQRARRCGGPDAGHTVHGGIRDYIGTF
jgi:small neutral amino acid transporter SnatA (MarC family)